LVYSEDVLLKLGYQNDVKNHLSEFIKLQRLNGQMPTVIDYNAGVSRLIPQTYQSCPADTEILFIIGMRKYAQFTGDKFFEENEKAVKSCVASIESRLSEHRLVLGMDWRDAMPNYKGKFLLANQMLLAGMYDLLGKPAEANLVKDNINKFFHSMNQCSYADAVHLDGGELKQDPHFDSFGNALAVLNGTAAE
jgi:hypothetical protein